MSQFNPYALEVTRKALYGDFQRYNQKVNLSDAWFSKLYEDFALYPYLELGRQEVQDLLFKKTFFSRLVPVFSKRLRITSLLNDAIGADIFKSNRKGIIEELAEIILEEVDSRNTLNKRIKDTEKKHSSYTGITYPIVRSKTVYTLNENASTEEGKLICIEGHLVHINSIKDINQSMHSAFEPSGIKWFISDFPYFQMIPSNKYYDGSVVGLRFSDEINRLIGNNIPFNDDCGWYPYVKVYGAMARP